MSTTPKTTMADYLAAKTLRASAARALDRRIARRLGALELQQDFVEFQRDQWMRQAMEAETEAAQLGMEVLTLATLLGQHATAQEILDENRALIAEAHELARINAHQELEALGDKKQWIH